MRPPRDQRLAKPAWMTGVAAVLGQTGTGVESVVVGSSMHPTLPQGARVRIASGHDWTVGDVIAFVAGDVLVAHRAVAVPRGGRFVLTRGDATRLPDPPCPVAVVLGPVCEVWREDSWHPVPRPPVRSSWWSRSAGALDGAIRLTFAMHPVLARWLQAAFYVVARASGRARPFDRSAATAMGHRRS